MWFGSFWIGTVCPWGGFCALVMEKFHFMIVGIPLSPLHSIVSIGQAHSTSAPETVKVIYTLLQNGMC